MHQDDSRYSQSANRGANPKQQVVQLLASIKMHNESGDPDKGDSEQTCLGKV